MHGTLWQLYEEYIITNCHYFRNSGRVLYYKRTDNETDHQHDFNAKSLLFQLQLVKLQILIELEQKTKNQKYQTHTH